MTVPPDPPKWLTLLGALCIFLVLFLVAYFGAALVAGVLCGASLRFQLRWTGFNCKAAPAMLFWGVYFGFIFSATALIPALRKLVTRVYRLTIVGGVRERR